MVICLLIFVVFRLKCTKLPNVYFISVLKKVAICHVSKAFKRPPRPNAPTFRLLTSVVLKGIEYRDQPWFSVFKHSMDHEEGV